MANKTYIYDNRNGSIVMVADDGATFNNANWSSLVADESYYNDFLKYGGQFKVDYVRLIMETKPLGVIEFSSALSMVNGKWQMTKNTSSDLTFNFLLKEIQALPTGMLYLTPDRGSLDQTSIDLSSVLTEQSPSVTVSYTAPNETIEPNMKIVLADYKDLILQFKFV